MPMNSSRHPFDRLARLYRWAEWATMGRKLQQCREKLGSAEFARWIPAQAISHEARWLLWGDGDGRFGAACAKQWCEISIEARDVSPKMLELAQQRYEAMPQPKAAMEFHVQDFLAWQPPREKFAGVATPFFLDCFTDAQLETGVARIAESLEEGGFWYVCDFYEAASGWRKWRSRLWTKGLYFFFRLVTKIPARKLPDWRAKFLANQLELRQREILCGGLLVAELWQKTPKRPTTLPR